MGDEPAQKTRVHAEPLGDGAVRWERDPAGDARALRDALRAWPKVIDAIVTEKHACVTFDPQMPPESPWEAEAMAASRREEERTHVIAVRYDGVDLDDLAARASLSRAEVIARHASRVYTVKLVGFMPGFAYLGDVDDAIAAPRRATPRPRVPAGAVGIAAAYTGVYPFSSAGGWNLVGTVVDFRAFDPDRGAALALGDPVRFEPA
jgi:UPF0271 protein